LFAPAYIPKSMVVSKEKHDSFRYNLASKTSLQVQVTDNAHHRDGLVVDKTQLKEMDGFNELIPKLQKDVPYTIKMKSMEVFIPEADLYTDEYLPVGPISVFRSLLFNCRIRKNANFKPCCDSKLFYKWKWYIILKGAMKLIWSALLLSPTIIRVVFFTTFELDYIQLQESTAQSLSTERAYDVSLMRYLTPLHPFFIVAFSTLSLNIISFVLLGFLNDEMKTNFQYFVKKCVEQMLEDVSKRSWFMQETIKGISKFMAKNGVWGIILFPIIAALLLPFWLLQFAFYMFPLFNIVGRLLQNLVAFGSTTTALRPLLKMCAGYDCVKKTIQEARDLRANIGFTKGIKHHDSHYDYQKAVKNDYCSSFLQSFLVIFQLFSLTSLIVIMFDCVSFYAVVMIYTFIGIVINFDSAITYISIVLLVLFYGKTCFGSVCAKYAAFFNAVVNHCTKLAETSIREYIVDDKEKEHKAFSMNPSDFAVNGLDLSIRVKHGYRPQLQGSIPFMLNKSHKPHLLDKFFYEACNMNYEHAPGAKGKRILTQYWIATFEFLMILLFLTFVLVVVFAFGNDYEISTSNKTILTVMGGVVPFLLTTFVFKGKEIPDWSSLIEDVYFQSELQNVFKRVVARFFIKNIEFVGNPEEVTSQDEHGTINNIDDFIELTRNKRQDNDTVNTNRDRKLFKLYIVDSSVNSTETETSPLFNMAEKTGDKIMCPMCTGLYRCCAWLREKRKSRRKVIMLQQRMINYRTPVDMEKSAYVDISETDSESGHDDVDGTDVIKNNPLNGGHIV